MLISCLTNSSDGKAIPPELLAIACHHGVGEVPGSAEIIPTNSPDLPKASRATGKCQMLMFQNPIFYGKHKELHYPYESLKKSPTRRGFYLPSTVGSSGYGISIVKTWISLICWGLEMTGRGTRSPKTMFSNILMNQLNKTEITITFD